MVTPPDERFQRSANRLIPSSNTRGSAPAAPAGSGQQAAFSQALASQRQAAGISADAFTFQTPEQRQQAFISGLQEQKASNILDKTILAGTRWGVVELPGGVKFVNPLKTVFSGLTFVQEEVAAPIAGNVIGGASLMLARTTNWSSAKKIARDYEAKMGGTSGLWWDPDDREKLKEFNRDRDNLFWGEKFASSILADPTTYIGFGWAMKLPKVFAPIGLAGKEVPVLGALERGWISTWNKPFDWGARAFKGGTIAEIPSWIPKVGGTELSLPGRLGRGVPLSKAQAARAAGNKVYEQGADFMREVTGGKSIESISKAELTTAFAQVLDVTIPYKELPSNGYRRMRDALLSNGKMSAEAAQVAVNDVLGETRIAAFGRAAGRAEERGVIEEVIQNLQRVDNQIKSDQGIRFAMSEVRDLYVNGSISVDEAAEQWLRLAKSPLSPENIKRAKRNLEGIAKATHTKAQGLLNDETPQNILEYLRAKTSNELRGDWEDNMFERIERLGAAAPLVHNLNKTYNVLYQRTLKRLIITPMNKAVLTFGAFPIQNLVEDGIRWSLGQGGFRWRKRSAAQFQKSIGGRFNVPNSLVLEGRNILGQRTAASRASALDNNVTAPFGETGLFESVGRYFIGNKYANNIQDLANNKWYGPALKWLNPDHWYRQADQWSRGMRRGYYENAFTNTLQRKFANEAVLADGAQVISDVPNILPKDILDPLQNELAVAYASGSEVAVREVLENYTGATVHQTHIQEILEKNMGAMDLHPSTRDILREAIEVGDLSEAAISKRIRLAEENEFEAFRQGLGGFEVKLDIGIGQLEESLKVLKAVPLAERTGDDLYMAQEALHHVMEHIGEVDYQISELITRASIRAGEVAYNAAKKEAIHKAAQQQVNGIATRLEAKKAQYVDAIRRLELEAIQGRRSNLASLFERKVDNLLEGWRNDRAAVEAHFTSWARKYGEQTRKTEGFWNELREIRGRIQTTMRNSARKIDNDITAAQTRQLRAAGGVTAVEPDFTDLSQRLGSKERYSLDDLAEVAGQNAENVSQAIMKAAWLNKDDFVDFFVDRAAQNGVKNIDPEKVADVYTRIQRSFAVDDKIGMSYIKTKSAFRNMEAEVRAAAKASPLRPQQEKAIADYVERIAQHLEAKGPEGKAAIKNIGQSAADEATEQLNRHFVNYDDQNLIDDVMQNIFPFWTYETRRIPWLLRTAGTNPVVWNTFGPEGRYWEATDDGYVHAPQIPWMDINIFGGTLLNAPRRMKKGDMPQEYTEGIRGVISGFEQQIAQMGFYAGSHMNFAMDAIFTGDLAEAAGQSAPPPLTGGVAGMQALAASIGAQGIAQSLGKMRTTVLPDKFRDYETLKIIWDMGLNPAEVDPETWTPRPGAEITQAQINDALNQSARVEWVREMSGMVRYRGDNERIYRQERDKIQMEWTGLNKQQLDEAKRQGIPLTSIAPMPPGVARILHELEGAEEFNAAVSVLSTGEKARIEELGREMWQTYDALKQNANAEQAADDLAWASGEMGPAVWRDRMSKRKQAIGGFIDQLRGFKRDEVTGERIAIEGEFPYREVPTTYEEYVELQKKLGNDTVRIQHPTSQVLEMYYGIAPVDRDGDGVPEWDEYFDNRERLLGSLPPELRREVVEEIELNKTEADRILGRLQQGILGEYWKIDREVAEEMEVTDLLRQLKIEQRTDPTYAEVLRKHPLLSRHRKEVQRRKDLLRAQEPVLDYALNVFGFTGDTLRFKNLEAREWWYNGDGIQGNRPYLGYFDGYVPPKGAAE